MELYIALPFLVGAVLAAPQQQHAARDTKPFKEPAADRSIFCDPKTIGAYRVLNKDDYDAGIRALYQGNQMYNRYGLMIRLNEIRVSDDEDKEGTELIEQLSNSNEGRLRLPGESLDLAKREFTTAFVLEFSDEINQAIQEARSKLSVAWDQARDANVNQLANLSGWFRGKTEEKYYQTW
ncbi:hypothetical protein J3459_012119 [Metarhizium acridum]|uniref:uncharacterized protein n=1 Tax=Metarhizium acridum TaxID=92637 RepID=UPI001C6C552B|nr:hypothetical protein J3458_016622 [Metarhizium acridum]KAG8418663.1 hypothetical protein J3459_012119 [Metarhizium acridum]